MLLRSTLFSWCFLDYWAASHGRIAGNVDNGLLLQVKILAICLSMKRTNHQNGAL